MSTGHTPGPWFVSQRNTAANGIEHAVGGFAAFTAIPRTVSDERLEGESWLDMRERTQPERDALQQEQTANARLIAAAPELLEALVELLKHGTPGDKERAVLAIKKATGAAS